MRVAYGSLFCFTALPDVMKQVPPMPGEEALYKWIGSVLDAAAKDPDVMKTLRETAVAADKELVAPMMQWRYDGQPAARSRCGLRCGPRCRAFHVSPPAF